MAQHYWYLASWVERDIRDGDPNRPVWLPRKVDVIAPNEKEVKFLVKTHYLDLNAQIIHLSIAKLGTQEQYLESQGQLELEFKGLDPFSNV